MNIETEVNQFLPALAWIAEVGIGSRVIQVQVGHLVEHGPEFVCEAVWDGPFSRFDFDKTDLVFGSGLRLREGNVVFVSPGPILDRLWHVQKDSTLYVSNSLPLLLARSGLRLRYDYDGYRRDIDSICKGLMRYTPEIPSDGETIQINYSTNLIWNGSDLVRSPKPIGQSWSTYEAYRSYLMDVAERLGDNATDASRRTPVSPVTTISKGYDSPAAAVVARRAGATQAHTIVQARSLLRRSDDGSEIAEMLGYSCARYRVNQKTLQDELPFLAALGWSMDINFSVFRFKEPLNLLFTGLHGGAFWDPTEGVPTGRISRQDPNGVGLTEYRLRHGIINCPIAMWGAQHEAVMNELSSSAEMANWSVGGDYDRPIPRRLVEEAGVPRSAFGQRKKATSLDFSHRWPVTRACRSSFESWLGRRQGSIPLVRTRQIRRSIDLVIFARIRRLLDTRWPRFSVVDPEVEYLFAWANNELASELLETAIEPNDALAQNSRLT